MDLELNGHRRAMKRRGCVKSEEAPETEMKKSKKAPNVRKAEVIFFVNEYLAVRNEEDSYYLCICQDNVKKSTRKVSIQWLDKAVNRNDIYHISYYDKIDVECVLTALKLEKKGSDYKLKDNEQDRIEIVLKDLIESEEEVGEIRKIIEINSNLQKDQVSQDDFIPNIGFQSTTNVVEVHAIQNQSMQHERQMKKIIQTNANLQEDQISQDEIIPNIGLQSSITRHKVVQTQDIEEGTIEDESVQNIGFQSTTNVAKAQGLQSHSMRYECPKQNRIVSIQPAIEEPPGDKFMLSTTTEEPTEAELSSSINNIDLNASALHYSSNESQSIDVEEPIIKKIRSVDKGWIILQTFDDPKLADEEMAKLTDFSFHYAHTTQSGLKRYFRCNKVQRRTKQCTAEYHLHYYNKSITMLKSTLEHDHDDKHFDSNKAVTKIDEKTKPEIDKLLQLRLKPKAILSTLRRTPNLVLPTLKQLYGYIARTKKKTTISLGELEKWLVDRSAIPDDDHEVFVVHYEVNYDEPYFRFFVSTKNLLSQTVKSQIVHCDATYKLNWEGFPNLVVGVTDRDRHFHPSGFAVCMDEKTEDFRFIFQSLSTGIHRVLGKCYKPTTLVADAAQAIHNGFKIIFGDTLIIMCWAHVKRAVKKRYKSNINLVNILQDLNRLQISPSVDLFKRALELFFEKWKLETEFIDYFKEQWVESSGNWFEGVQQFTPKSDNALEGTNRWIKDSHKQRQRLPLVNFLEELIKMVNDWSSEYIQDKIFITVPTILLPLWTSAYQWVKLKKHVIAINNDDILHFKIPATGFENVVEMHVTQYKSFEDFSKYAFACYYVEMPVNNWSSGTCTCPSFYKEFVCKQ